MTRDTAKYPLPSNSAASRCLAECRQCVLLPAKPYKDILTSSAVCGRAASRSVDGVVPLVQLVAASRSVDAVALLRYDF